MDNAKNFSKVTVSTGYDASATSIVLTSGHGAKLPTAPFNAIWFNSTDYSDPSDDPNVEIVRVTAISTDTLTVIRAQEGTSASTKNTGGKTYKMVAGLTAKVMNQDLSPTTLLATGGNTSTAQNLTLAGYNTGSSWTLTGNCTFTLVITASSLVSGTIYYYDLYLIQDGTGSRTITFAAGTGSTLEMPTTSPAISGTLSAGKTRITLECIATSTSAGNWNVSSCGMVV